jgi:large subunit ribosomal protein L17
MHRHGYKGRKFGRERDQRRALMRGLAGSLIEHGKIKTSEAKAKDLRPKVEKLITRARKGGLANRRIVMAKLDSVELGRKLVDEIAPQLKRNSGYLRIERLEIQRRGDLTEMVEISFVDEIKPVEPTAGVKTATTEKKPVKKAEPTAKKPAKSTPKTTKKGGK